MHNHTIYILWDSSQLWGLMALRAMRAFGLHCRLVKAQEISQGALLGKLSGADSSLLIVPGGSARQKEQALGEAGKKAIRLFVKKGGIYLGICGGAGLALSSRMPSSGLGLCPWPRARYARRLYHLLSGHVEAVDGRNARLALPIWWPGRFDSSEGGRQINILARYSAPAPDLWLADLPLYHIPPHILSQLGNDAGPDPIQDFPSGQPLVISGKFGRGHYILSYAHLETPQSQAANAWLGRLLDEYCGLTFPETTLPVWQTAPAGTTGLPINQPPTPHLAGSPRDAMKQAHEVLACLVSLAEKLGFMFTRTSWLKGWRAGIPGMAFNNLLAETAMLREVEQEDQIAGYWSRHGQQFCRNLAEFSKRAETFLWARRIHQTLEANGERAFSEATLMYERNQIFGHPMSGGGLVQQLGQTLEELVYLAQPR